MKAPEPFRAGAMQLLVRQFPIGGWQHERAIGAALDVGFAAGAHLTIAAPGEDPMSGPYGGTQPPAILLAWSSSHGAWRATAIVDTAEVAETLNGPSTAAGRNPADALQQLLAKRFTVLTERECAPTPVELSAGPQP